MCRLYGFHANEETKVECPLVHAQNALIVQSEQDLSGYSHTHGWGVATYEDHVPHVERQAWAAYHGEHFRRAAARIYAKTVIAHVRRATVGPAAIENTHPFVHGTWAFIHNGTIPNFDRLRKRMLEAMTPEHSDAVRGVTDSEHLFRLLISSREMKPTESLVSLLRRVIGDVARWCLSLDPTANIGLNVILTDGVQLVGTRLGRGLYYVEREGILDCEICGVPHVHHDPSQTYRAIDIASEPITHENWRQIPECSVFQVDGNMRLKIDTLASGKCSATSGYPEAALEGSSTVIARDIKVDELQR